MDRHGWERNATASSAGAHPNDANAGIIRAGIGGWF
jgi:hypothetical protein